VIFSIKKKKDFCRFFLRTTNMSSGGRNKSANNNNRLLKSRNPSMQLDLCECRLGEVNHLLEEIDANLKYWQKQKQLALNEKKKLEKERDRIKNKMDEADGPDHVDAAPRKTSTEPAEKYPPGCKCLVKVPVDGEYHSIFICEGDDIAEVVGKFAKEHSISEETYQLTLTRAKEAYEDAEKNAAKGKPVRRFNRRRRNQKKAGAGKADGDASVKKDEAPATEAPAENKEEVPAENKEGKKEETTPVEEKPKEETPVEEKKEEEAPVEEKPEEVPAESTPVAESSSPKTETPAEESKPASEESK